jgi:DNA-binding NarL/FixJ family response regulator
VRGGHPRSAQRWITRRTNAEIARELYLSVATIKAHMTHILTKLDLGNRTQIALLVHDARPT